MGRPLYSPTGEPDIEVVLEAHTIIQSVPVLGIQRDLDPKLFPVLLQNRSDLLERLRYLKNIRVEV